MKADWEVKPLGEVCTLKPPKKLAKAELKDDELVSFAGMSELGELQANFKEAEARPLSKVYSGYTYFADNDVLVAKITPCFENGKMGIARNLTNGIGFLKVKYGGTNGAKQKLGAIPDIKRAFMDIQAHLYAQ